MCHFYNCPPRLLHYTTSMHPCKSYFGASKTNTNKKTMLQFLHTKFSDYVSCKRCRIGQKGLLMALIMMLFMSGEIFAQEKQVSGIVTDNSGLGMPGINVTIKGTLRGTVTDLKGQFSIKVAPNDTLHVSFVGYRSQDVVSGEKSFLKIRLEEAITQLGETVIIGYGTQKKKLVTGATAQLKGEDLEKRKAVDPLSGMQGITAGVNITRTSGQPGSSYKVRVRGVGTVGNSSPIFIVDGVQTSDISFLNPSDVASIDVLKDAASAAIYGNQGANGVVLITTKSGKPMSGEGTETKYSEVTLDAFTGWQGRAKKIRMLNTEEYVMIMNEQHLNSGGSVSSMPFNASDLPQYTSAGVANTDWFNEMMSDNAITNDIVLGVNGGSKYSTYSMSLSKSTQEGIVGGSSLSKYDRYNVRINSDHKLFDDLVTIGEKVTYSHIDNRGIAVGNQYSNTLRNAFNTSPLMPVYDNNGEFFNSNSTTITDQNGNTYWNSQEVNPYALMYMTNQSVNNSQKLLGTMYGEIKFLKDFTFRSTLGLDYSASESRSFTPVYELSLYSFSKYNKASQRIGKGMNLSFDNLLTYQKRLGNHNITGMAGTSVQKASGSYLYGENAYLAFDDLDHAWLDNSTNTDNAALITLNGAPYTANRIISYFVRGQYNFKETYLFNATFRADGSSMFAKGHQWGYFPSVSAGWVITNEKFMQDYSKYLPYLKLRVSWGQVGNCNIDPFQYLAPISFTNAAYNFGSTEGVSTSGSYPSRLSNEELKWETSEQFDIGFDASFFDSRLSINFDYYRKTTKDWLITAPVLATAGTNPPVINGGNVQNNGVELVLSYTKNEGAFKYRASINGAYNKNKVTEIPTEDGILHGSTNSLYNNATEFYRAETGHAIGYFWGWETDGIFQTTDEVNSYVGSNGKLVQPNAKPGDLKYVDQNGDGKIDDNDKIDLGDPNPDFIFGFSFSASYKGFDFDFLATGTLGNEIVQSYRNQVDKFANYSTDILDRWHGEGTSTTVPRVTNSNINYKFSDIFVQDGSYLRIANITLGYELTNLIKIKALSSLRVYASVQNLYTFTNYTGMDPDVGYGFVNGATDSFSSGVDLGYYPTPRTILFGVSVKF